MGNRGESAFGPIRSVHMNFLLMWTFFQIRISAITSEIAREAVPRHFNCNFFGRDPSLGKFEIRVDLDFGERRRFGGNLRSINREKVYKKDEIWSFHRAPRRMKNRTGQKKFEIELAKNVIGFGPYFQVRKKKEERSPRGNGTIIESFGWWKRPLSIPRSRVGRGTAVKYSLGDWFEGGTSLTTVRWIRRVTVWKRPLAANESVLPVS